MLHDTAILATLHRRQSNDENPDAKILMTRSNARGFRALVAAWILWAAVPASAAESIDARVTVDADKPGPRIDPNIYGQFVEHLGRGVYEGIWVGENSPIPNVRGIRSDVVAALRKIHVPL